jgi:hypothetical protein
MRLRRRAFSPRRVGGRFRRWPGRDHVVRTVRVLTRDSRARAAGWLAPRRLESGDLGGRGPPLVRAAAARARAAGRAPPTRRPASRGFAFAGDRKESVCPASGEVHAPPARARDGGGRPKKLRSSSTPAAWRAFGAVRGGQAVA